MVDELGEGVETEPVLALRELPLPAEVALAKHVEGAGDRRMERLDLEPIYGSKNPLAFMELQDVQELSNFFERKVSAYQVGVTGAVGFDEDF